MNSSNSYYSYPKGNRLHLSNDKKYELKQVKLYELFNKKNCSIITPSFQRNLNYNIIDGLQKKMLEDFDYIISISNHIQLAFTVINRNILIVIDGQHRLEVFKNLINEDKSYENKEIFITLIKCDNSDEMERIYYDINIDKPTNIINRFNNLEIREIILESCYPKLFRLVHNKYYKYFDGRNKSIFKFDDWFNNLKEIKLVEKIYNNYSSVSQEDLLNKIMNIIEEVNIKLYLENYRGINIIGEIMKTCINDKKVLSIKSINFINTLIEYISFI